MVLAVGVAVMYPSTAKADPIRVQAGAVTSTLDARITPTSPTDQSDPIVTAQHNDQVSVDSDADATFKSRSGLEQSAYFANHGSAQVFADDRSSFKDTIGAEGLGVNLQTHVTIALRAGEEKTYLGGEVCIMRVPETDPSTTPEPGSLLLIATGLGGLLLYRRQLFA
ncbi:MAG: PEP-CTERM sorting domain-containing protein [Thermoanaerobaculia bacterium]